MKREKDTPRPIMVKTGPQSKDAINWWTGVTGRTFRSEARGGSVVFSLSLRAALVFACLFFFSSFHHSGSL